MTSVIDTRLLIFLEFPASQDIGKKTSEFFDKELKSGLLVPSTVLTEFIEVAGRKIGQEAAKIKLRLLEERGMKTVSLDEECALSAGELLLSHRNVPITDALIASYVKTGFAEYVLTDDAHFRALGVKTRWVGAVRE